VQIDVKEAAHLLSVSENTVYRWIRRDGLPASKVNDIYRLNKSELLEWATERHLPLSPALFEDEKAEVLPRLEDAIRAGGIAYGVAGTTKDEVLAAVVEKINLPTGVDRAFLLDVLIARESLGSTGLGDGVAVPHVRNPIVLPITQPLISLSFLAQPVDFAAVDGKPVGALFTMVSGTVKAHVHLLSRLAFGLRQPRLREAVRSQAPAAEILAAARAVDETAR
jgi:nitrogen PTS system EIIA component